MLRASRPLGGNGVCGEDDMAEQPNAEPDKQLSLASHNPISITVAGSGRREGEPGGQRSSTLPACLLPCAGQEPPAPRGALRAGCPLCYPECPREVKILGSGEPRRGTEPRGGLVPMLWAPWGGTRWVLPGGGASAAGHPGAGLGGLIRVLPVQGGGMWLQCSGPK